MEHIDNNRKSRNSMSRTQFQVLVILLYARGRDLEDLGGGLVKVSTGFISRLSGLKQEKIRPALKSLYALGYITSLSLAHGLAIAQLREPEREFGNKQQRRDN